MRRKKVSAALGILSWERRNYWRDGRIVDLEVWHAGRLLPRTPRKTPAFAVEVDHCDTHRTRIYADLPCQYCGESPDAVEPASPSRRLIA